MDDIVLPPPRSRLILERVLGLTALSNAQVAVNSASGELAYAAGCIVVIYNLRRDKQVRYYRVDKTVSCLCFSPSGQFLAIGEKGYQPAITIWDGMDGTLCAELQRHEYGVGCMAFSQDGHFLVSAGLVHDQHLYAWELKPQRKDAVRRLEVTAVGCAFVEDKVLDVDFCQAGKFFVTVGEKHFKYWFLDDSGSFLMTGIRMKDLPELQHRDAVMNAKSSATFTGVGCGFGSCEHKTFAITLDGILCCFGASGVMERLVSLESKCGNAISVTEAYVAVGGSSGVVRLFSPSTLEYCATLPFPPAFGAANEPLKPFLASPNILYPADSFRYPAVIATRITGSHVIVFYSDRSIFIYGTATLDTVTIERSFLYHSGGIRDLQVAGFVRGITTKGKLVYNRDGFVGDASVDSIPTGTFVTCSDDNTIRLWNLELHRRSAKSSRFESNDAERLEHEVWKNPHSQEMLRVIYNDIAREFEDANCIILGGTSFYDSNTSVHSPLKVHGRSKGLVTVAIRPDQKEIAAGDQEGNIVVVPMQTKKPVIRIEAHSSKVNCLAYSSLNEDDTTFMASGGQDRLIQLYDCQRGHVVLNTAEPHSAAVTDVSISREGKRLLSCGANNTLSQSELDAKGKIKESKVLSCISGKIFGTILLPDRDTVVACCNNKLEVLSVSTDEPQQTHLVGEQRHIALCPASYCVAMSGSLAERNIHLIDLTTGDVLAVGAGHGDVITALKFTPDCRRLLSASGDGCIFVWRLADDIQTEIKARLPRVTQFQPVPCATNTNYQGMAMPPPAPPLLKHFDQKSAGLSSPARSKANVHRAQTSNLAEASQTAPKIVSKKSCQWKGGRVAVPGPHAAIPMEKWMRTRASARPTINVVNEAALLPQKKEMTLPSSEEDKKVNSVPLNEDDSQTDSVSDANYQQGIEAVLNPKGVLPMMPGNDKFSGKDELTSLSIKVLGTDTTTSSSLALEREHLEKRKKQLNTANAVATMNTRLSQLGFLKSPLKVAMERQSKFQTPSSQEHQNVIEAAEPSVFQSEKSTATGFTIEEPVTSQIVKVINTRSGDLDQTPTDETMLTIADASIDQVATSVNSSNVSEAFDLEKSAYARERVNEVAAIENSSKPFPVDEEVDASLSFYVNGYGLKDKTLGKECDEEIDQVNGVPRVEIDASLSSFTSGFVVPRELPQAASMEDEASNEQVASSLSVFTLGYKAESSSIHSDATLNVKPNDSIAIAGGEKQQVLVGVNSCIGECGIEEESVIDRNIDTKESVRPSTVASVNDDSLEAAAPKILANLCRHLEEAEGSLGQITSDQEQSKLNLVEVQTSIEALRSLIASTLNH